MMTQQARYYSDWRAQPYSCPCGWKSSGDELALELFDALMQLSCPTCDRHLLLVSHPTFDEIREAAARGNEEARAQLSWVERLEAKEARFERMKLRESEQLPEVEGDELHFVWDLDEGGDLALRLGDQVLWREPVFYEDWPRFNEVRELLKRRYPGRFRSLKPTDASEFYLFGDDISAPNKISFT